MAEQLPSNDDPDVKLLSVHSFLGDHQEDIKAMDEQNRYSKLEGKIDDINKTTKDIQGVVTTRPINRVATGAKAFSQGLKDNWKLFEGGTATDKVVGVLNIVAGVTAAIPPPYDAVSAVFGIFSDILQIVQDKPSEIEVIQAMIDAQTEELKKAIKASETEIKKAIKKSEINIRKDLADQISGLIEDEAAGAIALAQQHLFNRDYLMYPGKLSDDKLSNIQKAIDDRTKLFAKLQSAVSDYLSFGDDEQKEIDEEHKKKDAEEGQFIKDRVMYFALLNTPAITSLKFPSGGTIFTPDSLADFKNDIDQEKKDIEDIESDIQLMKQLKLEYVNIGCQLLNLYCNLSMLHNNIIYLVSYRLIARDDDEKNSGYINIGNGKISDDYPFLTNLISMINYGYAATGPQVDGCHYQVYADCIFETDQWKRAAFMYNKASPKYAKVILCNGVVVAKYGDDKWTNNNIKEAREKFSGVTLYQVYSNNEQLTDEIFEVYEEAHDEAKAEQAYEGVPETYAKVLTCNGYIVKKAGDEESINIGIESLQKEFLNRAIITQDSLQYLSLCNIRYLMTNAENGNQDMTVCSVDLSPFNYQPRSVTVKFGDKEEETLEFVQFKEQYGSNLKDSKDVWFNPLTTFIQ